MTIRQRQILLAALSCLEEHLNDHNRRCPEQTVLKKEINELKEQLREPLEVKSLLSKIEEHVAKVGEYARKFLERS